MKKALFSLLTLCILLFSCTRNNEHNKDLTENRKSYSNDTMRINTILRNLKDDPSVSNDSLIKSLNEAGELSRRSGYENGMANVLFQLGNIAYYKNTYSSALNKFSEALKIAETIGDKELQSCCIERIGSVHLATDDSHLALQLYYKSLAISEGIGDSNGIAKVYNILGFYKGQSEQYDTGVAYLKKAVALNEKLNNKLNKLENLGNLAYLYQTHGKVNEAKKIYSYVIPELKSSKEMVNLPVIYYNLASLHQELNQIDSSYYYLRTAAKVAEQTGDTALLSTIYGNTGELKIKDRQLDSARIYLAKSIEYSKLTDDVETQLQAISFLIRVDTLTGNTSDAIKRYNQSLILQDSVYQRKIRHSKESTELQYQNDKKSTLIELQGLALHSAKKERYLYIGLLLVSASVIGLITLILVLQRRNHRKDKVLYSNRLLLNEMEIDRFQKTEEINKLKIEKIEEELKVKERELTSIAIGIEQKNELLNLNSTKLKDLTGHRNEPVSGVTLNKLISSIKLQSANFDESDLFNQRFSMIHQGFFPNLKNIHPELTKTELKFCAYLKVNLSGSQIANILNVTQEAIRKTRYRIRKKMNLPSESSLEDYISRF
ncbi:MAG: tetratricopeptide repeat protein [Bacteroidetes bacterium]|nr:tetratricopeptide repeat protein [Bacteroidota bacterium]